MSDFPESPLSDVKAPLPELLAIQMGGQQDHPGGPPLPENYLGHLRDLFDLRSIQVIMAWIKLIDALAGRMVLATAGAGPLKMDLPRPY